MIKYLCICAVYYLFPLFFHDTGGFIIYLLVLCPVLSFLCALFPSMKYGYELLFPVLCGVLFIPSALLYFNETAFIEKYIEEWGLVDNATCFHNYKTITEDERKQILELAKTMNEQPPVKKKGIFG